MCNKVKIFYNEKMSVNLGEYDPISTKKPTLFIQSIADKGMIVKSTPIKKEDLYLAHRKQYVDDIFNFKRPNGFMNTNKDIPQSILYTIGSLKDAAEQALKAKSIMCSPTSGFHHACYDHAEGFCTFNGLIVVARMLQESKKVKKVAILDCDFHYGNGTDDIINKLSIENITNYSLGKIFVKGSDPEEYLHKLRKIVNDISKASYDIVIYQAGADLHIKDTLGGILSVEQMKERDRIVFSGLSSVNLPIVWNLAGGYAKNPADTIKIHLDTLEIATRFNRDKYSKK